MSAEVPIRPFREEDARPAADLFRRVVPDYLLTAERLLHDLAATPERAQFRMWVAHDKGEIVGYGEALLHWRAADPRVSAVWVCVAEASRRRGLGAALYELGEQHVRSLDVHTIRSSAPGAEGHRFAAARGFVETRAERASELDIRTADLSSLDELEAASAEDGYHVMPLNDLLDRRRDLHQLYEAAERDIPTEDEFAELDYEEWETETLGNPLLDLDGSMVVLHGERPVSFAWILTDREGGRGEHELTGTLPEYRGRRLARLAKLAAVRWCAENGITTLLTGNDAENAPMLAINRRLGYRPTRVWTEYAKTL